ncbi:MAG: hypothetical protein ACM65M_01205 [Microcoleus sp.]
MITRDLQRSCFVATNIFVKHRCTRRKWHVCDRGLHRKRAITTTRPIPVPIDNSYN